MRADMAQVLIERPRRGPRFGYRRQRRINRRADLESAAQREAISRRPRGHDKHFNDLFGPVRRFLNNSVGRPWDQVYSEICRHANSNNVAQRHLRRHVHDFVETCVILIDGVPCHGQGWNFGRPLQTYWQFAFYVCPKSGLLRRIDKPSRRRVESPRRIGINKWRQFHRIGGVWYVVALRPIPQDSAGCFDAFIGRRVEEIPASKRIEAYGHDAYALSSRPANAAERNELQCKSPPRRKTRRR